MTLPSRDIPYILFYGPSDRDKTESDILELGRLPSGWHYGKGEPIRLDLLKLALQIHRTAISIGFEETEASPGQNGEVMISVFYRDHCLDFVIQPDRSIDFYHEVNDEAIETAKHLAPEVAKAKLIGLGAIEWNTYGLFTGGTTAPKGNASRDWPLRTIQA